MCILVLQTAYRSQNPFVRNLTGIFLFKWTVNWRFLPEHIFLDRYFHVALLVIHFFLLVWIFKERWATYWDPIHLKSSSRKCFHFLDQLLFWLFRWISLSRSLFSKIRGKHIREEPDIDVAQHEEGHENCREAPTEESLYALKVTRTLFLCNFVGVICSRSLHYQFYVWYFYSLPLLLWSTPFNTIFRYDCVIHIFLNWPFNTLTHILYILTSEPSVVAICFSSAYLLKQTNYHGSDWVFMECLSFDEYE